MKTLRSRFRAVMLSCVIWTSTLCAHPADVSQLRVHVEHERIEFRFTINVAAISRVVRIDSNHDNQITFSEITAAVPIMRDFLTRTTLVTINNESANLGDFVKNECFWPHPETSTITPQEEGTRFVDFNFTKPWPKGVEDVWLGFKVFEQLGDLHIIQCIFQQPNEHDTPVDFSATEPEYLYDTGWSASDTASQPAGIAATAPYSFSWPWLAAKLVAFASLIALLHRTVKR